MAERARSASWHARSASSSSSLPRASASFSRARSATSFAAERARQKAERAGKEAEEHRRVAEEVEAEHARRKAEEKAEEHRRAVEAEEEAERARAAEEAKEEAERARAVEEAKEAERARQKQEEVRRCLEELDRLWKEAKRKEAARAVEEAKKVVERANQKREELLREKEKALQERSYQERNYQEEERALQEAEEEVELAEAKKEVELDQARRKRGVRFMSWGLSDYYQVQEDFDKYVTCVAVCGDCCLYVHEHGHGLPTWTSGAPPWLDKFLRHRAPNHPQPVYVAMGSLGRYYCLLDNGKSQWNGPEEMTEELQEENSRTVRSIAFGEYFDSYCIVYDDGWCWWSWRGWAPKGFLDVLRRRQGRADLAFVSFGENGDYFVRAQNGKCWWSAAPYISKELKKLEGRITEVHFGEGGACFSRGNW